MQEAYAVQVQEVDWPEHVVCVFLQVEAALRAIGTRVDARAQDLSPPQFAALYNQLQDVVLSQLTEQ
jgi:hypothetical protein